MLGFKIGEEYLILNSNTTVMFVLENPFFDIENVIVSPRGYNFMVPDDQAGHNRRLLGHVDNIATHNPEVVVPCWIMLNNNQWMYGDLISEYKNGCFECYWNQYQTFIESDLEKNLTEVDTGVVIDTDIYDEIKDRVATAYAGVKDFVNYPVYNPNLFNNEDDIYFTFPPSGPYMYDQQIYIPENFCRYLNYWNTSSWYMPMQVPVVTVYIHYAMSPAIYVRFMIEKLFAHFGFIINPSDFLEDTDIQKLTIWTNKLFEMVVERSGGGYTSDIDPIDLNDFLPEFSIRHFLEGIKKNFCLTYYWDFARQRIDICSNTVILENHEGVDWSDKLVVGSALERNVLTGYLFKTTYSDDALFDVYIKSIKGRTILPEVKTEANLLNPLIQTIESICHVVDQQKYYRVGKNAVTQLQEWQYYTDNYLELEVDEAKTVIESPADTLLRKWSIRRPDYDTQYGAKWTIPQSLENNDSAWGDIAHKTETLRLLFYRGMQDVNWQDGEPGSGYMTQYPYATHSEVDPLGNVIGDYSLSWAGDCGLYETRWRKYIEFLNNGRPYTRQIRLTETDLLNFDQKKSIFLTEKGSSTKEYVWKKITVQIGVEDIGVAEVEMWGK